MIKHLRVAARFIVLMLILALPGWWIIGHRLIRNADDADAWVQWTLAPLAGESGR